MRVRQRHQHRAAARACRFSAASPSRPPSAVWKCRTTSSIGISRKSQPRFSASLRASVACPGRSNGTASRRNAPGQARAPRPRAPRRARSRSRPRARARPRRSRSCRRSRAARARAPGASARARARRARSAAEALQQTVTCFQLDRPAETVPLSLAGEPAPADVAESPADRLASGRGRRPAAPPRSRAPVRAPRPRRPARPSGRRRRARPGRRRDCRTRGRRVVACARHEHLLAVLCLADMVRRGGDIHEQLGSLERRVGRRRTRQPDVLADRSVRPASRRARQEQARGRTRSSGPRRRRRSSAGDASGRAPCSSPSVQTAHAL